MRSRSIIAIVPFKVQLILILCIKSFWLLHFFETQYSIFHWLPMLLLLLHDRGNILALSGSFSWLFLFWLSIFFNNMLMDRLRIYYMLFFYDWWANLCLLIRFELIFRLLPLLLNFKLLSLFFTYKFDFHNYKSSL